MRQAYLLRMCPWSHTRALTGASWLCLIACSVEQQAATSDTVARPALTQPQATATTDIESPAPTPSTGNAEQQGSSSGMDSGSLMHTAPSPPIEPRAPTKETGAIASQPNASLAPQSNAPPSVQPSQGPSPSPPASPACDAAAPDTEPGHLWFSGYEQQPWQDHWGLLWSSLENHELSQNDVLFGNLTAQVNYPEGTVSAESGAQYRMAFSKLIDPIAPSEELFARYYVRFAEDFDFARGGKLPGLAGGEANTGGNKPDGTDGFSARIMWREAGRIIQYVYHPDQPGTFGEALGWDSGDAARHFRPGQWHCVETRIKLNTVGNGEASTALFDGVVQSWLDGQLSLDKRDLRFRYVDAIKVDSFYFSTFFGGNDATWETSKNESAQFDNFVISDKRIGCHSTCLTVSHLPVTRQQLVFDGEDNAWIPSTWNKAGTFEFASAQNHTPGGSRAAYIKFDSTDYDALVFTASEPFDPNEHTHVRLWVRPEAPGVVFRLQFRGTQDSADVQVDPTTTYHPLPWAVGEWQEVVVPMAAFASTSGQNTLLVRSANATGSPGFWIDDVALVVSKTPKPTQ